MNCNVSKSRINFNCNDENSEENDNIVNDSTEKNIDIDESNQLYNKYELRKKSVTFSGGESNQDSSMNDVKVINRRTSVTFSNDSKNNNASQEVVQNSNFRRLSMKKKSFSIEEGKIFDISSLPSTIKQEFIDEQTELALRDTSAELISYIMKNAIKIAITEIKTNI